MSENTEPKRRLSHATLAKLSGLSREQLDEFMRTWAAVPPAERRKAIRTMIDMTEDNVELDYNDLYRRLLTDDDVEVRALAVEGLWEDDRASTAQVMIELAQRDAAEAVRAAALDGLGRFALRLALDELRPAIAERIRTALLEFVGPETAPELRRRAIEASGYLAEEEPFKQAVQTAYASDEVRLRASAVKAMGRSCNPAWFETISREMASDEPTLRFEAARAAGETEDERFIPGLIEAVHDRDTEVRLAAIESLGAIGGQRARQALQQVRRGRDSALADAADAALEELDALADPLGIRVADVNPN
jgi:HEAT repeat protein